MTCSRFTSVNRVYQETSTHDLLDEFNKERKEVVEAFVKNNIEFVRNLWTSKSLISFDRQCKINAGQGTSCSEKRENLYPYREKYYECGKCRKLEQIVDILELKIKVPFETHIIDDEKEKNYRTKFVLTSVVPNTYYKIDSQESSIVNRLILSDQLECSCNPPRFKNIHFIGLDKFTVNILITWMFERIMKNHEGQEKPHFNKMFTAFICGYNGYTLEEPSLSYDDFEMNPKFIKDGILDKKICEGIVLQLFVIFHIMSKYRLSMTNVSMDNLCFTNSPCEYTYNGIIVKCRFTLKIRDFSSAGLTVSSDRDIENVCRIFYHDKEASEMSEKLNFKLPLRLLKIDDRVYFEIKDCKNDYTFNYMRNAGAPYFLSQLNFYSFFLMLCMKTTFFYSVLASNKVFKLLNMMFLKDQLEPLLNKIKNLTETCSKSFDPIAMLEDLTLDCNILERTMCEYQSRKVRKGKK